MLLGHLKECADKCMTADLTDHAVRDDITRYYLPRLARHRKEVLTNFFRTRHECQDEHRSFIVRECLEVKQALRSTRRRLTQSA